ncbi:MAG: sugar kinase, partial [Erysipelotrichaceae bacterium]|nr:sugar kinase [Erysipelotrichaceae bacterium]
MKDKIVAFGEIMLRLTPPDYTTISEAKNFIANYGGAEANVLVSLSHLGHGTDFITRVPDNQLGESAI